MCERKLNQLEQSYKNEINAVRYEREQYYREVTSKEIEKTRKELEKEQKDFQQQVLAEKKQLIEDYNKRIQEETSKFNNNEEMYKSEIASLSSTKSELQNKIYDLEGKIDRTKEQLTFRFTDDRRKLEYEFFTQLREMKETHRMELIERSEIMKLNMETKLKTEKEEFEERIRVEYKAKITAEVSSREKQLKGSLYKLEQEFRIERDKLLETERLLKVQNELLLREKEALLGQSKRDREELSKKMEHEKELLNVTLDAITRELSKMREEKNFLSVSFTKEKKELENKHEAEMTELRKKLERNKQELITRLLEENKQAAQDVQRSTDATIVALKDKLAKAERKMNEMEEHYKKEKSKLEHQFEHEKMELEQRSQKISQQVKTIFEQDFYRRSQENRKVHENALSSLKSEILELRESKNRLERALLEQQMIAYNLGRDINVLKSETRVSSPRKSEQSLFERELQELRHRNEKLRMATKEAQFYKSELIKWDGGKNCPVMRTAQEMTYLASPEKPMEIKVNGRETT